MQYIFNERREFITSVEFRNTNPILNIEQIKLYKEEGIVGNFLKKEFRYSYDNITWWPSTSGWYSLNQANVTNIPFNDQPTFYFHVKYTRVKVIDANIHSFYLLYTSATSTDPGVLDSSIIDADLLQGEDGEYYLDRSHHFGDFSDLVVQNRYTPDTSTIIGTYYIEQRIDDPSNGTYLYFRSIEASGGIAITKRNDGRISLYTGGLNIGDASANVFAGYTVEGNAQFRSLVGSGGIAVEQDGDRIIVAMDPSFGDTVYVKEASLNTSTFIWSGGYLDVSILGGLGVVETSINYQAGNNQLILANVADNSIHITLPPSSISGDLIEIVDITKNSSNNNIQILRNSHSIDSSTVDFLMDVNGNTIKFVYEFDADNYAITNLEGLNNNQWSEQLGTINSASNQGIGDVSIYYNKVLDVLQFKTIKAGDNIILSYENSTTIRIDASISDSFRNIGSGDVSIYAGKFGLDESYRTLKGSSEIILSYDDVSTIKIDTSIAEKLSQEAGGFFNGAIVQNHSIDVSSNGSTVWLTLDCSTTPIDLWFDGSTYDFTVPASINLTTGSHTVPERNYVYILNSTKSLTVNTSQWPTTEQYIPVADILIQNPSDVINDGAYKVHAWTDHLVDDKNQGHLSHLNTWIRHQHATWMSGVAPTFYGDGTDVIYMTNTSGTIMQLHHHLFPAYDSSIKFHVINDEVTPYTEITSLADITTDSTGSTLANRSYGLVIWGSTSEDPEDCKWFVNKPSGSYIFANPQDVAGDSQRYNNFSIPDEFRGTGFLVHLLIISQNAGGPTYNIYAGSLDLRGQMPGNLVAGSGSIAASSFPDSIFEVYNAADDTKLINLDAANITTGNTRIITMADWDIDLGVMDTSIGVLGSRINTLDSSVTNLTDWNIIQDNSIAALDISLGDYVRKDGDTMTGDLSMSNQKIQHLSNPIDSSDATNKYYVDRYNTIQDASIASIDASISDIIDIESYVNSSTYYDGSLNNIRAIYIPDASLSTDFYWNVSNLLEISTGFGGVTFEYVDGSFAYRDTSISDIWSELNNLDSSLDDYVRKDGDTMTGDLSIGNTGYDINLYSDKAGIKIKPWIKNSTDRIYIGNADTSTAMIEVYGGTVGTSYLTQINTNENGSYGLRTNSPVKAHNFYLYNTYGGFYTNTGVPMFYTPTGYYFGIGTITPDAVYKLTIDGSVKIINGYLSLNNNKIIGVETPTDASDATNKYYVDLIETDTNAYLLDLSTNKLDNTTDTFTGVLTIDGSLVIYGDLFQDGSAFVINATSIDVSNNFITLRVGAVTALPDGSISGLRITKPDGTNDVIFGTANDAVLRIGWEGDTLQAIATREDTPTDTWYVYWDDSSTIFKTYDLLGDIDSSLSDVWTKFGNLDTSLGDIWGELDNLDTSLGDYVLKAGDTMTGDLSIDTSLNVSGKLHVTNNIVCNNSISANGFYWTTGSGGLLFGSVSWGLRRNAIVYTNEVLTSDTLQLIADNASGMGIQIGNDETGGITAEFQSGDTHSTILHGPLVLQNNKITSLDTPTDSSDATNKYYVDQAVVDASSSYVQKAGDTMTGDLLMSSTASIFMNNPGSGTTPYTSFAVRNSAKASSSISMAGVFSGEYASGNNTFYASDGQYSYRVGSNQGLQVRAIVNANQLNTGGTYMAGMGTRNVAGWMSATMPKDNAINVGSVGWARNTSTNGINIGGYFGFQYTGTPNWSESAALIADNYDLSDPIFLARDNGTKVFSIIDGGEVNVYNNNIINLGYPTDASDAVNKFYVDSSFALKADIDTSAGLYVLKAGDTMTGDLTISDASIIVTGNVEITGDLLATTKSFLIKHPIKEGKKLQYGNLEGPEHAIYHRGRIIDTNTIELPEYWSELTREETVTVQLTSNKPHIMYVKEISKDTVKVGKFGFGKIDCFYTVYGERKDVPQLKTERE